MPELVIVESPGKIKTLQKYLGDDYVVKASVGHIRDLPANDLGLNPETGEADYVFTERGQQVVTELRKLAKTCSKVWLATDADREGEAIAWHLKESLNLSSYERVVFREITKPAVQQAFTSPRAIDMDMVNSQQGRRLLDRVIGWVVSPALGDATGERLSAGRVQSVALLIIHDLEERIKKFVTTNHFSVKAIFEGYDAEWNTEPFVSETEPYFMDKEAATRLASCRQFTVKTFSRKQSTRNAPPPLTTSTMQQAASVALRFSTDKTMKAAQRLYELGAITYHRTDSLNLSEVAINQIREYLASSGRSADLPDTPNKFTSKGDAQDAHEAIRPSDVSLTCPDAASSDEQALYELIRNRAIACQMKPAIYNNAVATLETDVEVPGFAEKPTFFGKARSVVYAGWMTIAAESENEDDDEVKEALMPDLVIGSSVTAVNAEVLEKATKAPKRLTEAALVRALEREGIGRPSTYASIIGNIINRNYIEIKSRLIHECSLGALVINSLKGNFQFLDLSYTRNMETALDDVAAGTADFRTIVKDTYALVSDEALKMPKLHRKATHACGECGRALFLVRGEFWACSGYATKECQKTYKNKGGKPDMTIKPDAVATEHTCRACGLILMRRVKEATKATRASKGKPGSKGKPAIAWYGCTGFPKCKQTYFEKDNRPDYPE